MIDVITAVLVLVLLYSISNSISMIIVLVLVLLYSIGNSISSRIVLVIVLLYSISHSISNSLDDMHLPGAPAPPRAPRPIC